ncbi:MAG: response regulator transcription factor [Schleiferilactobacillus perolens]|uniref:response regulator transcription factor n=1 Tax=Schleiferilactobacillus perolens TaxID=100468 RepID=UPI0039EB458F
MNKPRILVIEDNQSLDDLLVETLQEDFAVSYVQDGATGISRVLADPPDLVILDLMLPIVSGESVLKTVRKTSAVPILVLTAVQDKGKVVDLLEAGANDYLTKPFDLDELTARIRVQLRTANTAGRPVSQATLQIGDITLDPAAYTVQVGDQSFPLAKKEYAILKLLMGHPQQVFPKADLYTAVWHEPYIGGENTLAVHLSNLRKKINQPGGPQYIQSLWGLGVRFAPHAEAGQ